MCWTKTQLHGEEWRYRGKSYDTLLLEHIEDWSSYGTYEIVVRKILELVTSRRRNTCHELRGI